MGRDNRQEALEYLLLEAERQGYVTFDNIMDCADVNSLPIQDFDWLSSAITVRGILVYDETPTNRISAIQEDDEYDDYAQSDYEAVYNKIIELDESLKDFVNEIRNIIPPQRKEFGILKYQAQEGNQHARDRMIEMHLRIALKIALQRAETYDMDITDAVSEACIGLITAVDKYDPDSNGAFGSYAAMWILQNISRRQSTRRELMYYPVHKKDPYFSAYPILKSCGYIDEPEMYEIEDVKDYVLDNSSLTEEQFYEVIEATIPFESFEKLFDTERNDENESSIEPLSEIVIEDEVTYLLLKEQIKDVLSTLNDREKQVLVLRFGLNGDEPRTLEDVGVLFNVTRERARQIEGKALKKLRHPSRSRKLKDYLD